MPISFDFLTELACTFSVANRVRREFPARHYETCNRYDSSIYRQNRPNTRVTFITRVKKTTNHFDAFGKIDGRVK